MADDAAKGPKQGGTSLQEGKTASQYRMLKNDIGDDKEQEG